MCMYTSFPGLYPQDFIACSTCMKSGQALQCKQQVIKSGGWKGCVCVCVYVHNALCLTRKLSGLKDYISFPNESTDLTKPDCGLGTSQHTLSASYETLLKLLLVLLAASALEAELAIRLGLGTSNSS